MDSVALAVEVAGYGNPEGREVYFTPESMRFRWLDRAAEAMR
jgi:hypothetical protein